MRITQNMLSNQFLRNLTLSMNNMERLQQQMSSGKKVSRPSDDPVVAVRSLQFNSQIRGSEQYKRNLGTAVNWMDTTDAVLQEAHGIFKTIREKLIQVSNGGLDDESRKAIAREMEQLKEQIGSIANTNISGRYIFAGTETDQQPYVSGNFVNTNSSKISVELGKQIMIDINVNGKDVFGFQDTGNSNKNIFQLMDDIVSTIDTNGNTNPLIDKLSVHENNFLKVHSKLGANKNRVELIENRLEEQILTTTEILSREEDADLAEVIMNLNMQENVHRAALSTGARIMQPTLMDFLR